MFAKLGIVGTADVVPNALDQEEALGSLACLSPLDLCAPGPQHILGSVLQLDLARLPLWPQWQTQDEVVCQ